MSKNENDMKKYPLPQTISKYIFNNLKEAIINNELKANQRINEKELVEQFRVSRTPVREAVLRLAAEGFVQIDSYRRAVVKEISYGELKEIFQVLGSLDSLAVGLAADNLTLKRIRKLEQLVKRMEKNCNINSIEKYLELNLAFHNEIWKAVPNKFLVEILILIRDKLQRYNYARIYGFKAPGALERSLREHKELIRTILAKDKEKLKNLIVKHRSSLGVSSTYNVGIKKYLTNDEE